MEIQQLRHLMAAAECGNLLHAAEICNISQSGLSRSIRALEERMGVPLLVRLPKGVILTAYGETVLARARVILNEVGRAVQEVHAIRGGAAGRVLIGITQNFSLVGIPTILAAFTREFPDVRISISTGGFLDVAAQVRDGGVDFGFGLLGNVADIPDITIEGLRVHHARVVAGGGHALAHKREEITPQDLAAARWVTLLSTGFQQSFAAYFELHDLPLPVQVVSTDSIPMMIDLVAATDLIAVLPPDIVRPRLEDGSVAILDCDAPAEQTRVALIFRKEGFLSPVAQQVAARLRRAYAGSMLAL